MANIWYGKVNTKGDYEDLETIIETTINPGVTYRLQPLSTVCMIITTEKPTEGGFIIYGGSVARFELTSGQKVWIKTYNDINVPINLAT